MLKEKLLEDLKNSMKDKNINRKNVVQMVRAAILQVEKDKQNELTNEQIVKIIAKEAKKRKESITDYEKGGREDLVKQIEEEISVLEEYLPKQLSQEETAEIVKKIIEKTGASNMKDMGNVMKEAKQEIGAAADGKMLSDVVKSLLQ